MSLLNKYLKEQEKHASREYGSQMALINGIIKAISYSLKEHQKKFKKSNESDYKYVDELIKIKKMLLNIEKMIHKEII